MTPDVTTATRAYLTLVDDQAPGLVDGFYLVGSLALGDYRPGQSDIDFVARMAAEPTPEQIAALGRVHAELSTPMPFDGVYVTADDLLGDPTRSADRPHAYEGRFEVGDSFEVNPAVWQTLAQSPVVLRGGLPQVSADRTRLDGWTRDNLRDYWLPLRSEIAGADPSRVVDALVVWVALGVTRLYYTLVTGLVTAKSGAGEWASGEVGPRPILREALRLRAGDGSGYTSLAERRQDLLDYLSEILTRAGQVDPPEVSGTAGHRPAGC
ncbi:nucleotidyltransferase domain-containing protein [Streptosporangium sp. NBC_01756]|uniref:nucleotidyltransferase domain-containing protein n=1 Tax=Streptosporangium sp. NBC_01756 TaxID=2975950 RepID=UPI002DD7F914|nr:nucleotidyltransferase domain-containing protein [Streptosporangium sp. NBC_01756]WSC87938.1 nucleotidyltransferase domain-containing protein [Streptosporangium sp. NBC_01756]